MGFVPIIVRELSVAARRPATFWVRTMTALVVSLVGASMLLTPHGRPARLGHDIFGFLSGLTFVWALLAGVRCTADSLSEERREGTLGFLFLTDLRGYDVVLGKLMGRVLEPFYSLIAVIPILGLTLLFGAVTGSEFWRMGLLLLTTLLFSLCLGLVISALGQSERAVVVATFFILVEITAGLPLTWMAAHQHSQSRWLDFFLLYPSPAYGFYTVTDASFRLASKEYWLCLSTLSSLSLLALVTSSLVLPRVFHERDTRQARALRTLARWRFGSVFRKVSRKLLLESHPFLWLLTCDRLPGLLLALFSVGIVLSAQWIPRALSPPGRPTTPIALLGSFGLHLTFKLLVASEACRRLNLDKRSGALGLLLTTPLPVASILKGQLQALRRFFVLPLLALAFLNCMIFRVLITQPSNRAEESMIIVGGLVMAGLDFWALSWVGMMTGLREKRFVLAMLKSLGAVMAIPWAIVLMFMFGTAGRAIQSETVRAFFFCWFGFCTLFDIGLVIWAKGEVRDKFRRLVSDDMHRAPFFAIAPLGSIRPAMPTTAELNES